MTIGEEWLEISHVSNALVRSSLQGHSSLCYTIWLDNWVEGTTRLFQLDKHIQPTFLSFPPWSTYLFVNNPLVPFIWKLSHLCRRECFRLGLWPRWRWNGEAVAHMLNLDTFSYWDAAGLINTSSSLKSAQARCPTESSTWIKAQYGK